MTMRSIDYSNEILNYLHATLAERFGKQADHQLEINNAK
jgi:hypothetical protein